VHHGLEWPRFFSDIEGDSEGEAESSAHSCSNAGSQCPPGDTSDGGAHKDADTSSDQCSCSTESVTGIQSIGQRELAGGVGVGGVVVGGVGVAVAVGGVAKLDEVLGECAEVASAEFEQGGFRLDAVITRAEGPAGTARNVRQEGSPR
jgi:hypothetical protein